MQLKSRLKAGCRVGPYETVQLLGVGYSGEVHEAVHAFTGQRVALKCLHTEHMESDHKVSRFSAEATALFKLGHANVVRVLDAGWDGTSHPWMAMELLTGHTLGELLTRQGRLSPLLALQYALDIAWGIDAAHENGVIHRDLKPDNVFVVARSGAIKVLDFSAAKFLTSDLRTTKPPDMTCTLAFGRGGPLSAAKRRARTGGGHQLFARRCIKSGAVSSSPCSARRSRSSPTMAAIPRICSRWPGQLMRRTTVSFGPARPM